MRRKIVCALLALVAAFMSKSESVAVRQPPTVVKPKLETGTATPEDGRHSDEPTEDKQEEVVSYEGCSVYRVTVKSKDHYTVLQRLNNEDPSSLDLDFWAFPGHAGDAPADVMACGDNRKKFLQVLEQNGMSHKIFVENVQSNINEESTSNVKLFHHGTVGTYASHNDINNYLQYLQTYWGSLATVIDIGSSYQGRRMKVIKIARNDGTARKGFFIEAGIHAREWISPASMLYVIDRLVRYSTHEDSKAMLDRFDWYFLPVTNPDGYEYSRSTNRLWRKNRRYVSASCRGVDLNRNWAAGFGGSGSSSSGCSQTYRGSYAFSEYETRRVRDFLNHPQFASDYWSMYMAVHSYSQLWLTPYAYTSDSHPADDTKLTEVAQAGADAIQSTHGKVYVVEHGYDLYIASGVSMDWAKATKGIPYAYTLELRPNSAANGGFIIPTSEIIPTGQEIFNAFRDVSAQIFGCFSPNSKVQLESGEYKTVANLVPGDKVEATDSSGKLIFTDVISFLDYNTDSNMKFLEISTDNGKAISVTEMHLLFMGSQYNEANAVFAKDLTVGDYVFTATNGKIEESAIIRISMKFEQGYVAPLTTAGTIVVDGVAASCYAAYPSHFASHFALLPLRMWHFLKTNFEWLWLGNSKNDFSGIHPYVMFIHSAVSTVGMV